MRDKGETMSTSASASFSPLRSSFTKFNFQPSISFCHLATFTPTSSLREDLDAGQGEAQQTHNLRLLIDELIPSERDTKEGERAPSQQNGDMFNEHAPVIDHADDGRRLLIERRSKVLFCELRDLQRRRVVATHL